MLWNSLELNKNLMVTAMRARRLFSVLLFLSLFTGDVKANDTEAELAVGGLVFSQNRTIQMTSEDLFISPTEVIVKYEFFNPSKTDVTITVAFPLPDLTSDGLSPVVIPSTDSQNFVDFTTKVDGQRVTAQVEQKAVSKTTDVTEDLRRLGVPLNPFEFSLQDLRDPSAATSLRSKGLLDENDYPTWTLKTTFYWNQVFPAGQRVHIEHRYKPSVGGSVGTRVLKMSTDSSAQTYYSKYCVEPPIVEALRRAQDKTGGVDPPYYDNYISYVLSTGANWSEPIGRFRLLIDKGSTDSLVSFCAKNVKKVGPTLFEVTAQNYTPSRDLDILLLKRRE